MERRWKPVLLMVAAQAIFAGVNIFYKLAAKDGMNLQVLVAYRFLFSALFILPLALWVERKKRPRLTWMVVFQGFWCGILGGTLAQNLYVKAISLTSATFVAATTNLVPAITFVLAVCFRMERLGTAKVMGTVLGIGGAMLLTFYKGIELWKTNVDLMHGQHHATGAQNSTHDRLMGSLMAIVSTFSYSMWLILQTNMVTRYPCPYSVTAITLVMGTIQSFVFGLCTVKSWSYWKLGWNIRLLSVAYTGVVGSGVMYTLIARGMQMRGPLFVSAFSPLGLVLVAIVGSLVLNESIHLGSVLGAILIVFGLYVVLWGKGKETENATQIGEPKIEAIDDESECSNLGDGESKHSSKRTDIGGSNRIEIIVPPPI